MLWLGLLGACRAHGCPPLGGADGASLGLSGLVPTLSLQSGSLRPPPSLQLLLVLAVGFCLLHRAASELGARKGIGSDERAHEAPEDEPAVLRESAVEPEDELVEIGVEVLAGDRPLWVPSIQRFTSAATRWTCGWTRCARSPVVRSEVGRCS